MYWRCCSGVFGLGGLERSSMNATLLLQHHRQLADDVVEENYPLALGLDFIGACLYSAGLVLQRYALSYPSADGTVSVLGCRMRRSLAWCLGLMTYGSGNGVYTVAMQYAPVSLLTTVFAVALVINAVLSRAIMHESIDRAGAAVLISFQPFVLQFPLIFCCFGRYKKML